SGVGPEVDRGAKGRRRIAQLMVGIVEHVVVDTDVADGDTGREAEGAPLEPRAQTGILRFLFLCLRHTGRGQKYQHQRDDAKRDLHYRLKRSIGKNLRSNPSES